MVVALAAALGDTHAPALSAPAAQQAPGDSFLQRHYWYADQYSNEARDLFPLDETYSTVGATLETDESAPCAPIASSIWIGWTADRFGRLDIDVTGAGFDAIVAVYQWDMIGFLPSPPGAHLLSLACDEAAVSAGASVSVDVTPGTEYLIQIGSRSGGGDARVQASCVGCAPPNDAFDRLHYLYLDAWQPKAHRTTDTSYATLQPGEQRPCGGIGATVWYSLYTGTAADVVLSTEGSNFDTTLAVYRLSPPEYAWDMSKLELIACEDDGSGTASIEIDAGPEGYEYLVQAGGANGATGTLALSAECVPVCPPYNDIAPDAEYLEAPSEYVQSRTGGATLDSGEPRPCGDIGKTVWYRLRVHGEARVIVDSAESDFATVLAVYEGSPTEFEMPDSGDLIECESSSGSRQASITLDADGSSDYWLQAGGVNGAGGLLTMSVSCEPGPCPPYNDSQREPWYLSRPAGGPYMQVIDTTGATTEAGEPSCGDMGRTTWWYVEVYDPQPATPLIISTDGSLFDTAIAVYEGPPPNYTETTYDQLRQISCDEGAPGGRARVSAMVSANRHLWIQVGGRGGAGGELHLTVACEGACPADNDMLGAAWYAYPPYNHLVDTSAATTEAGEPSGCGNAGKTVWYRLEAQEITEHTISTAGSNFETTIAIYTTDQPSPPGGLTSRGCSTSGTLILDVAEAGTGAYWIQVGGVDGASGSLNFSIDCPVCTLGGGQGGGGGMIYAGGSVSGPDTGNGGYLPGAR
jgi:hypothetical protein